METSLEDAEKSERKGEGRYKSLSFCPLCDLRGSAVNSNSAEALI